MARRASPSGLAATPSLHWGSHLGQVFETADDLAETLVPYFKAGLDNNERCFWVTGAPLNAEAARDALREAVPDLDVREASGQIEIFDGDAWYASGPLDPQALIDDLIRREQAALDEGYEGLRTNGNCAWVKKAHWAEFQTYEGMVSDAVAGRRLICMCSYCGLDEGTISLNDVIGHHDFVLPRRARMTIEAEEEQEAIAAGADMFVSMMESLPAAICTTDPDGVLTYYNKAASDLWGYEPEIGVQRWCGAYRMYTPEGAPIALDHSAMAIAVQTGQPVHEVEAIIERPDGTRAPCALYPTPLFNAKGKIIGGINMLVDISAGKAAETRYRTLARELHHRMNNTLTAVQAIAISTSRQAETLSEFETRFSARLQAMAKTHALLAEGAAPSVSLRALLADELDAFTAAGDTRIALSGEDILLPEALVAPLSMAIHELATNAVKYGALAGDVGRLSVEWRQVNDTLDLRWREQSVVMPLTRGEGFGAQLLTEILPRQLNAEIELRYAPDGVDAHLRVPL